MTRARTRISTAGEEAVATGGAGAVAVAVPAAPAVRPGGFSAVADIGQTPQNRSK